MNTPEKRKEWHRARLLATATPQRAPRVFGGGATRSGDQALWLAVVHVVLTDAFTVATQGSHCRPEDVLAARQWFEKSRNPKRRLVCELAGVDEQALIEEYNKRKQAS